MRTILHLSALLCLLLTSGGLSTGVRGQIPPEEFARRRAAVAKELDSTSALVMRASDIRMRANDVNYPYRQESNFWYLTGVEEPNSYLLIAPAGFAAGEQRGTIALFVRNGALKAGGGAPAGTIGASTGEGTGDSMFDVERFGEALRSVAPKIKVLYVSSPDIRFVNDWLNGRSLFLERDVRKTFEQSYPGVKIRNAAGLLTGARGIKSAAEVQNIRQAIRITGDGLVRAMRNCRPGVYEYELQADIEYEMRRQGAAGPAFPSIVGSGPNSLEYHYELNRRQTLAGDLVVMDVGAEYCGYSADITRTIPVSGRFTKEQAEVYDLVLKAQQAAIAVIRPGTPFRVVESTARGVADAAGFGRYWGHGVSHHLGVDTHDAGKMDTLRAGMVVTVEPGLYIPASDTVLAPGYRGWGIRIEDDVLVTENGAEVLSPQIPKSRADVEAIVGKKGGR